VIGVDNQAAIKAIHGMESRPSHYLVDDVHRVAEMLRVSWPGGGLVIRWVPRHYGVPGKEAADVLAKAAAEGRG
jgi:ribonuclease HI